MSVKGVKSQRNQGEIYEEIKRQSSVALTKTGLERLDNLAASFGLSRSEFIERIGRKIFLVAEVDYEELATLETIAQNKNTSISCLVDQAIKLFNKTQAKTSI
jgi:metal-responsive CopG/Arc/MetJ family transcriptional regulator